MALKTSQPITIVSGLPRSGTSMMMQFLQAGGMTVLCDHQREADVNNPHGYVEYEPVKSLAKNADWLHLAQGKVIKIIAQLLQYLPDHFDYRILLMQRDMAEILASQQRMLQQLGKPSAADGALNTIFTQQLHHVQKQLACSSNIQVIKVRHHQMYQHNAVLFDQINAFCGGNLKLEKASAAIDQSLYRSKKQC